MNGSQAIRPAEGLFAPPRRIDALADLLANVWQLGYVTNDLDRAVEFMSDRFGLEHCLKLPAGGATFLVGDEPAEWDAKFGMGARGGKIVELIEPVVGHVDFYTRVLPPDGSFAVRLHHIATFIETGDEEWARGRRPAGRVRPEGRLHGADPEPRPRRLRRHDRRARALARDLPAPTRGHRVLQRAGRR
ncbi:MAG: hypothetical protein WAN22_22340 [Solirubrobacteraceae bacterium]